jgi:hypothetical protein
LRSGAATALSRAVRSSVLPDAASALNVSLAGLNNSALARKLLPLLPPAISTCPFGSGAATAA